MVAETLKAARDLIDRGWCQKSLVILPDGKQLKLMQEVDFTSLPPDGCKFCALGAILAAVHGDIDAADAAYERLYGHLKRRVVAWNDDVDRTKEEVLQVFDDVINSL